VTLWMAYVAGALFALLWKLRLWTDEGKSLRDFFIRSRQSGATTVTMIGCVWFVGAVLVALATGRIEESDVFSVIPPHPILFIVGSLYEAIAPPVAERISAWVLRLMDRLFDSREGNNR
jgi:hypothetical protein